MKTPLIWAHRGASGTCPENTLYAFEKAVELGADGIELDIQLTKDGKIVVIHDEKIDRTSDGEGWVKDYTYDELLKFNFNKTYPELHEMKIPLMDEVFELIKPTSLTIDIELKTGIVFYPIEQKILDMTKKWGMEDRVIYSSFNHSSMVKIKELEPLAKVGFLYADGPVGMADYAKKHGADALHPALYNLQYPNFMEEAGKNGLLVNVWTVNEEEYIKMCISMGVDAIITNYPEKVRKLSHH